jgi:hypothetical protein
VKDLIEEDKRPFALRRIVASLCCGLRLVYDEIEEKYVNPLMYPLQLILACVYPAIVLVSITASTDDFLVSVIIAASVTFLLTLIL